MYKSVLPLKHSSLIVSDSLSIASWHFIIEAIRIIVYPAPIPIAGLVALRSMSFIRMLPLESPPSKLPKSRLPPRNRL